MKNEKGNMSGSKLTGQEISTYFRKNPKAKAVKKAVEIALDHGGAMNYAIKEIEKLKRGLSKHPEVKKALDYANFESVQKESVQLYGKIISENYTRNFETLCNSLKLNGIQQKILDDFIHKGRIRDQYVGRAAGSKKETRIFAGKKKFSGSIDNRTEALMNALKVNAKQKSILDAYLKTGNVVGKYTGSIAGSTKTTKSYAGFRGFKEHFEIEEKVGKMRSWRQGWDPAEEDQLRKDKKLKKDLEKYMKKDPRRNWSIKQAAKEVPYLLKHINTNFGDGKGQDLSDKKPHQFHNAILSFYDYEYLYESVDEARSMSQKDIMRKYGRELKQALRKGTLELSDKAEEALQQWVYDNYPEDIRTDDPDEWIEWLDRNLEDFVKGKLT